MPRFPLNRGKFESTIEPHLCITVPPSPLDVLELLSILQKCVGLKDGGIDVTTSIVDGASPRHEKRHRRKRRRCQSCSDLGFAEISSNDDSGENSLDISDHEEKVEEVDTVVNDHNSSNILIESGTWKWKRLEMTHQQKSRPAPLLSRARARDSLEKSRPGARLSGKIESGRASTEIWTSVLFSGLDERPKSWTRTLLSHWTSVLLTLWTSVLYCLAGRASSSAWLDERPLLGRAFTSAGTIVLSKRPGRTSSSHVIWTSVLFKTSRTSVLFCSRTSVLFR
ncbi:hypothetical protein LR48_Vigan04g163600 [Vigna angularis]|uniref:Uncharacterized protein n=1 Tax=Phaseolus angularis TaxID=3914 RepID=A0A0L9UFF2_PHAAN|nr:hypothetical protein LR48_Vigan04g163600 [Vigna angularis]